MYKNSRQYNSIIFTHAFTYKNHKLPFFWYLHRIVETKRLKNALQHFNYDFILSHTFITPHLYIYSPPHIGLRTKWTHWVGNFGIVAQQHQRAKVMEQPRLGFASQPGFTTKFHTRAQWKCPKTISEPHKIKFGC